MNAAPATASTNNNKLRGKLPLPVLLGLPLAVKSAAPCISVFIFEGPSALENAVAFVLSLGDHEPFAGAGLGADPADSGEALGAAGDGDDADGGDGEGLGLLLPPDGGIGDRELAAAGQ